MLRILIVDDTPVNLFATSKMLQQAGFGVATAANGEEGVKMAGEWRYDLIVMDMAMPDMSGSEATRKIRDAEEAAGTQRVPVIAFTAYAMEEFRQRALRSGMDDFIVKPIERRKLVAAVERSVDARAIILVADDHTQDRERTLRFLRGLDGVGVVSASTGAEAVAACERQRVTLALINATLPDMDGAEAAQQIRKSKHGQHIGIVTVTDKKSDKKVDPEAQEQSAESGNLGVLEKPFGQAEILKVIQPLIVRARPAA